jgi:signal transduction histidine kinase
LDNRSYMKQWKPKSSKQVLAYFLLYEAVFSVSFFVAFMTRAFGVIPFIWVAIGLGSFAAFIYGIYYYKPLKSLAWGLLAAAIPMTVIGGIVYTHDAKRPSIADLLYLAAYAVSIAGITLLIRQRTARDIEKGMLLDAAIISLGLAMILWTYLVLPSAYVETSFINKLFAVSYPILDIVFWAMLIRLLIANLQVWAVRLIALGALSALMADIVSSIGRYNGSQNTNIVSALGSVLFYVCLGAAALHPSMKALDETAITEPRVRMSRLVLLASSTLIAPSIIIIEALRGTISRVAGSIAIFAALMFILVILRMYTLIRALGVREAEIETERNKNETLGIVAHQLKTPATGVSLYINMVIDGYAGKITKSQRGLLDIALTSNQRLIRIIDDLLDISRVNAGKVLLYKSESDVIHSIKDIMAEMKPQFEARNQKLFFEHKEHSVVAMVDDERLKMVLENILDNASKYTPEGKSITIVLRKLKRTFQIKIKDQGVGIEQKDLEKLFQKFSRIDNPLSKGAGGSGLGLSWAQLIIELHGGTIKVRSVPHKGTTFIISLPLSA